MHSVDCDLYVEGPPLQVWCSDNLDWHARNVNLNPLFVNDLAVRTTKLVVMQLHSPVGPALQDLLDGGHTRGELTPTSPVKYVVTQKWKARMTVVSNSDHAQLPGLFRITGHACFGGGELVDTVKMKWMSMTGYTSELQYDANQPGGIMPKFGMQLTLPNVIEARHIPEGHGLTRVYKLPFHFVIRFTHLGTGKAVDICTLNV